MRKVSYLVQYRLPSKKEWHYKKYGSLMLLNNIAEYSDLETAKKAAFHLKEEVGPKSRVRVLKRTTTTTDRVASVIVRARKTSKGNPNE